MISPSATVLLRTKGMQGGPTWTKNCVLYVKCCSNFECMSGLVEIQEAIEKPAPGGCARLLDWLESLDSELEQRRAKERI